MLATLSSLGLGLATDYWQLIVWRLLQGCGSACFSITALIVMGKISTPSNRGAYMSFFWTTFLIGGSIGPSFGGFIGEFYGYQAVFYVYSALALSAALWGYFRIPETSSRIKSGRARPGSPGPTPEDRRGGMINRNFILIARVAF